MKHTLILLFALCMATAGFANGARINTHNGPGDDKNKKLLQVHKQITLFSFTIFSIPVDTDTISTIANFGSIDRFRKATAPDPEPNKIR